MDLSGALFFSLISVLCLGEVLGYPVQYPGANSNLDEPIEDRRRKHKRKKRPCSRNDPSEARWFFGHDLTLYLGDVTIVSGGNPCTYNDQQQHNPASPVLAEHLPSRPGLFEGHKPSRPGLFGGQKPGLLGSHKPGLLDSHRPGLLGSHRPGLLDSHRPGLLDSHKPIFPLFGSHKPGQNENKPDNGQSENKPVYEIIDEDEEQQEYRPGSVVGAPSAQIDGHGQDLSNFSPTRILSHISRHFNRIVDPFIDLFY